MQKKLRQLRAQLEEAEDDKSTLQAQMSKMRSAQRRNTKVRRYHVVGLKWKIIIL